MKLKSYSFDNRLYELLQQKKYHQFTTRDLRDAYAEYLDIDTFCFSDLRKYLYEQICRMLRLGWLTYDVERRKRGQVYHLNPMPKSVKLKLIDHGFEMASRFYSKPAEEKGLHQIALKPTVTESSELRFKDTHLNFILKKNESEIEVYKILLDEISALKDEVESDRLEARKRSLRILGHLSSIETSLKRVMLAR